MFEYFPKMSLFLLALFSYCVLDLRPVLDSFAGTLSVSYVFWLSQVLLPISRTAFAAFSFSLFCLFHSFPRPGGILFRSSHVASREE